MKRFICDGLCLILFSLSASGCFVLTEVYGGYSTSLLEDRQRQGGVVNARVALGTQRSAYPYRRSPVQSQRRESRDISIGGDIQIARLRMVEDAGRVGAVGGGLFLSIGEYEFVSMTVATGVTIIDFGWGDREGWGMFSPYLEVGGAVRFGSTSPVMLTFHTGLEYEVRFSGPTDGLYLQFGLGLAFVIV